MSSIVLFFVFVFVLRDSTSQWDRIVSQFSVWKMFAKHFSIDALVIPNACVKFIDEDIYNQCANEGNNCLVE